MVINNELLKPWRQIPESMSIEYSQVLFKKLQEILLKDLQKEKISDDIDLSLLGLWTIQKYWESFLLYNKEYSQPDLFYSNFFNDINTLYDFVGESFEKKDLKRTIFANIQKMIKEKYGALKKYCHKDIHDKEFFNFLIERGPDAYIMSKEYLFYILKFLHKIALIFNTRAKPAIFKTFETFTKFRDVPDLSLYIRLNYFSSIFAAIQNQVLNTRVINEIELKALPVYIAWNTKYQPYHINAFNYIYLPFLNTYLPKVFKNIINKNIYALEEDKNNPDSDVVMLEYAEQSIDTIKEYLKTYFSRIKAPVNIQKESVLDEKAYKKYQNFLNSNYNLLSLLMFINLYRSFPNNNLSFETKWLINHLNIFTFEEIVYIINRIVNFSFSGSGFQKTAFLNISNLVEYAHYQELLNFVYIFNKIWTDGKLKPDYNFISQALKILMLYKPYDKLNTNITNEFYALLTYKLAAANGIKSLDELSFRDLIVYFIETVRDFMRQREIERSEVFELEFFLANGFTFILNVWLRSKFEKYLQKKISKDGLIKIYNFLKLCKINDNVKVYEALSKILETDFSENKKVLDDLKEIIEEVDYHFRQFKEEQAFEFNTSLGIDEAEPLNSPEFFIHITNLIGSDIVHIKPPTVLDWGNMLLLSKNDFEKLHNSKLEHFISNTYQEMKNAENKLEKRRSYITKKSLLEILIYLLTDVYLIYNHLYYEAKSINDLLYLEAFSFINLDEVKNPISLNSLMQNHLLELVCVLYSVYSYASARKYIKKLGACIKENKDMFTETIEEIIGNLDVYSVDAFMDIANLNPNRLSGMRDIEIKYINKSYLKTDFMVAYLFSLWPFYNFLEDKKKGPKVSNIFANAIASKLVYSNLVVNSLKAHYTLLKQSIELDNKAGVIKNFMQNITDKFSE